MPKSCSTLKFRQIRVRNRKERQTGQERDRQDKEDRKSGHHRLNETSIPGRTDPSHTPFRATFSWTFRTPPINPKTTKIVCYEDVNKSVRDTVWQIVFSIFPDLHGTPPSRPLTLTFHDFILPCTQFSILCIFPSLLLSKNSNLGLSIVCTSSISSHPSTLSRNFAACDHMA